MADASTAARERIDRALALLESKVHELKARSAAPAGSDDDLFASPAPAGPDAHRRIAELEAAGRDAGRKLMEIKRLRQKGHAITLLDEARFWRLAFPRPRRPAATSAPASAARPRARRSRTP